MGQMPKNLVLIGLDENHPGLKGPITPIIYFRFQVAQKQARASANLLLQKTGLINKQKLLENGSNIS